MYIKSNLMLGLRGENSLGVYVNIFTLCFFSARVKEQKYFAHTHTRSGEREKEIIT
jgi:hypothetical protein